MWTYLLAVAAIGILSTTTVQANCLPPKGTVKDAIPPTLQKSYRSYELIEYNCFIGYRTKGDDHRTYCKEDGTWTELPTCERAFPSSEWNFEIVAKPTPPPFHTDDCKQNLSKIEEGRQCRKSCVRHSECEGSLKSCVCDGDCGFSCFNPEGNCSEPSLLANGQISFPHGLVYGNSAVYSCNERYRLVAGSKTRTCRSDKAWSGKKPTCEVITCSRPEEILQGEFINSQAIYNVTEALIFSCMIGYRKKTEDIICEETGLWSETPMCIEITCPKPIKVKKSMKTNMKESYSYNDVIEYECEYGFKMVGNEFIECIESGNWTEYPKCEQITCKPPNLIGNFKVDGDEKKSYVVGDLILFSCNPGYIGGGHVECTESAEWTEYIPCEDIDECQSSDSCPAFAKCTNSIGSFYCQCFDGFGEDDKDDEDGLKCTDINECEIKNTCPQETVCQNSEGSYNCVLKESCETPEELTNGTVTLIQTSSIFMLYYYSCNDGFYLDPEKQFRACNNMTMMWSKPKPFCQPGCSLSSLSPTLTTDRKYSGYPVGSFVTVECIKGYEISANAKMKIQCLESLQWSQSDIYCEKIECGRPSSIIYNGGFNGENFLFNDFVKYFCDEGYVLVGESFRVCKDDRLWNGTAPKCEKSKCGPPQIVPNTKEVQFKKEYSYEDIILIECEMNYVLENKIKYMRCRGDGNWTVSPICSPSTCLPPDLKNGRVESDKATFTIKESINISCQQDGKEYDRFEVTCAYRNTWRKFRQCPDICIENLLDWDIDFFAFSNSNVRRTADEARMSENGWRPNVNDINLLIMKFSQTEVIASIGIKGYKNFRRTFFVTKFKLYYEDEEGEMIVFKNKDGTEKVFKGNSDGETIKETTFAFGELKTQMIYIIPTDAMNWPHLHVRASIYKLCT